MYDGMCDIWLYGVPVYTTEVFQHLLNNVNFIAPIYIRQTRWRNVSGGEAMLPLVMVFFSLQDFRGNVS